LHLTEQSVEGHRVARGSRPDHEITRGTLCVRDVEHRPKGSAYRVTESSLHEIALHRAMPMLGDDEADPRVMQKGGQLSDLEMRGPKPLPLATDPIKIRGTGHPADGQAISG